MLTLHPKPRWINNTLHIGVGLDDESKPGVTRPQFIKLSKILFNYMIERKPKYIRLSPDLADLSPYFPHATSWLSAPNVPLRQPAEWLKHDCHTL